MANLAEKQVENLMAGFAKCGISPYDKQKLLGCLPANQVVDKDAIGESFIELLEKKRSEYLTPEGPKKKRKKLQVPAGKSVSLQEVQAAITENSKSNKPSTSKKLSAMKKSSTHFKLLNKKSGGLFFK